MTENRRSDPRPRRSGVRMAFVFAAMLAVFLQAFAVQTHIHAFAAPVIAAGHEQALDNSAAPDGAHAAVGDHRTICVICQALAANGSATLTDSAQLAALTASSNETTALAIRRAPRALTHSWQSRAPPIAA